MASSHHDSGSPLSPDPGVAFSMHSPLSRRALLRLGLGTVVSCVSAPLAQACTVRDPATSLDDYKALVCVLLGGGNDGHNWIVPTTEAGYRVYSRHRTRLALAPGSLLPLNGTAPGTGHSYGMNASCPELQGLFNSGAAAFLCNVGPLVQPTTKAQAVAASAPLPTQLFSHLDQTTQWFTGDARSLHRYGWGGRIADMLIARGHAANLAYSISVGGGNYWQEGRASVPYSLGLGGAPINAAIANRSFRNGARSRATQALIDQAAADPNLLVREYASILTSAASRASCVDTALSRSGSPAPRFPGPVDGDSKLGEQLKMVARMIEARAQIGDSRQMFFVQIGGFDTHNDEIATQATLLGFVSRYLKAFWDVIGELGVQKNVTVFTVSDFGRTLTTNGDGADHGWGNHQLVLGGSVKGGRFYGTMPNLTVGGPDDMGQGRLIPTTSVEQSAATLARWFGVGEADLVALLPTLPNFSTSNLGFMA
ncbi:MAG: DUF1501 domain-containing protein [Gammaproteobacteria bacterium]